MSAPLLPAYPARVSMCAMLLAFGGAAGCAPGFPVERHRLGPPRIAPVGVLHGACHAPLWSGLGRFTDQALRVSWAGDGATGISRPTLCRPPCGEPPFLI